MVRVCSHDEDLRRPGGRRLRAWRRSHVVCSDDRHVKDSRSSAASRGRGGRYRGHSAKGDGRCISRRRPARSLAERRLMRSHSAAASGERLNRVRSARTWRAASVRCITTNDVTSVPDASAARSMSSRSSSVVRTSSRRLRVRVPMAGHCTANRSGSVPTRKWRSTGCRCRVRRQVPSGSSATRSDATEYIHGPTGRLAMIASIRRQRRERISRLAAVDWLLRPVRTNPRTACSFHIASSTGRYRMR